MRQTRHVLLPRLPKHNLGGPLLDNFSATCLLEIQISDLPQHALIVEF